MESTNEICILKWSKFENNITESIHNLRNVDDFYDVTLVGDDFEQVKAHKIVLSATSEYFKKILQNIKGLNHPVLCLEGLNYTDINNVMDFIYNGQLELPQDDVKRYLAVAERLKLFGIYEPDNSNYETAEDHISIEKTKDDEDKTSINSEKRTVASCVKKPGCKKEIQQTSTKSSNDTFSCNVCQKVFKLRHHMKEHMETHVSGLSYECQFCERTYKTRSSLRSHEHKQHRMEREELNKDAQEIKEIERQLDNIVPASYDSMQPKSL